MATMYFHDIYNGCNYNILTLHLLKHLPLYPSNNMRVEQTIKMDIKNIKCIEILTYFIFLAKVKVTVISFSYLTLWFVLVHAHYKIWRYRETWQNRISVETEHISKSRRNPLPINAYLTWMNRTLSLPNSEHSLKSRKLIYITNTPD